MSGSDEQSSVLSSSAVMAAGTLVSRLSGFVRSALLAAALGAYLHADIFTIANTIPNMVYILLVGGVFNAVLVPQLVRAMRNDEDGGEAYTNRIITLAGLFLLVVTVALVAFAPTVMSLYLDGDFYAPERTEQLASVIAFARYCLPQVFFYGMFVLVGQILNSRRVFGPMMWAPIANNVISVATLVVYLFVYGPARGTVLEAGYSPSQELLLGLGSTLGIAVQLLILVPYLKRAGFTFRPRFDFRGTGLGHTFRLGVWTVLFVIVNQVAYTVVVRLASSGTADAGPAGAGGPEGTGYFVYSSTFLIMMVPHSIITVSLATAILPRLSARAAEGDLRALGTTLASTLRSALVVMVPIAALLPVVAVDASHLIWGYGATSDDFANFAPSLSLFGIGLLFFTVHYLMLRGFYALEQTRTVFFIQCGVAAVNITAALVLVGLASRAGTSPALVAAYGTSYAVGAFLSSLVLSRSLGGDGVLQGRRTLRFLVRLGFVVIGSTAIAGLVALGLGATDGADSSLLAALVRTAVVGVVDVVVFVVLAKVFRLREVTSVISLVSSRLSSGRGA
ncbi:murein biosynthesis integral membrane protein MurJ [Nocardioides sp.]|uniref:murein biosynthesis integral membrane protein MurJ n=1 Tax=Nocardioides sp. TaxID=35761 RepID=UPI002B26A1B5|nr:murein biosynthesis integral membrane protein MurJ [Nocardioides sp.]